VPNGNDKHVNEKVERLEQHKVKNANKPLTNDLGHKIPNDRWTLRAGQRGPVLFEDFQFYRKQSRFNRERIPEKVVHARGFGVHGVFECTKSMQDVTTAHFLGEVGRQTPVFVRFSNFIGNKGSKDTAQDVRGFATKFYTQEGNYDNLALNFGVFILADAMKFMDFTHAVKPNPITDVPQATAAHERIWDYISNNQESAHFVMWLMSMRGKASSFSSVQLLIGGVFYVVLLLPLSGHGFR
jgi:catalase